MERRVKCRRWGDLGLIASDQPKLLLEPPPILGVKIRVETNDSKDAEIMKAIKKVANITANEPGRIIVTPHHKTSKEKAVDAISKIDGVLDVITIDPHLKRKGTKIEDAFRTNYCVLFFDVDSTLTRGGSGTIHPKIMHVFDRLRDRGIWIFFVTGRAIDDATALAKEYKVSRHAIAENGGIVTGFGDKGYHMLGDKQEPNKVLRYLKTKYGIREDMDQGIRITEVIFKHEDVDEGKIKNAIRSSKAHVDIHSSKNAYHISKRGIDKGSAMLWLARELRLGEHMLVAVGDADMDIPMFKNAGYSFAVGNASPGAKEAASETLKGEFERGIEELLEIIESS